MKTRMHWARQTAIFALVLLATALVGCSYSIKYDLNSSAIRRSPKPANLRVAVLPLDDRRDPAERLKQARKDRGDKDAGDFTCDKDFSGNVSVEISKMIAKHLDYAGSFAEVDFVAPDTMLSREAEYARLRLAGYDAVLAGSLTSFTGYYDRNSGREIMLTGALPLTVALVAAFASVKTEEKSISVPGSTMAYKETTVDPVVPALATSLTSIIGSLVESSSSRDIAWQTALSLKLIQLESGAESWSDSIMVGDSVHTSMPGIKTGKRKQEVAVASLREAVNVLVEHLAGDTNERSAAEPANLPATAKRGE